MTKRVKQAALVVVVVFAAAQLIRPDRANPATDVSRTIQARLSTVNGLDVVLDRSCHDCHSNRTVWPWYTQIAPVSWVWAYSVKKGRNVINFSDWAAYTPDQQRSLLTQSCRDATEGKMPQSAWTWLHPETRLSNQDVQTICAAARL